MRLTVLYDAGCPLCARFRDWLARQPLLVPLELVAAGSPEAVQRFPTLDHARSLREVTVVADDGALWVREHAWVMCLWATVEHRALAERLATPAWLPLARVTAQAAAGLRSLTTSTTGPDGPGGVPAGQPAPPPGGDYRAGCAGSCEPHHPQGPLPQGPLPQG